MAEKKTNTLGDLRKEKALRDEILKQKITSKAATEELTAAAKAAADAELAVQSRRLEMMIELAAKNGKYTAAQIAKQEELIASQKRQVSMLGEMSEAQDRVNSTIDSFAAKAGASVGILDDLASSGLSVADVAHKMKAAFSDANGKLDLLKVTSAVTAPIFNEVKQQLMLNARAVADMTSSVASATGEGMKYNSTISSVGTSNKQFGVGMVEAGQAVSALSGTMSTFSMQGKDTAENMVTVAARMESLGVSAETSGAQMEYGMRIMGQTGDEAAAGVDDLAKFAKGIGVAPAKMAADFQAAAPALAGYGKEAMKVFKGLAAQSKKTGLSMNELLGVTEQFDSFDTAASAAGNLNSILGGQYLDSMQLVTAETEAQRAELLQNALLMSGQSFDSMSRLERKAVASSIGISDMSVATKLLSESSRAAAKDMKDETVSQEQLAQAQQAGVSFTKKMQMVMQSFAVALMPVANMLHTMASGLIDLTDNGVAQFLIGTTAAIYMLVKAVQFARVATTAWMAVSAALKAVESESIIRKGLMATKNFILGGSAEVAAKGSDKLGKSGKKAGKGIGSLGRPLAMLGIGLIKVGLGVLAIGAGIGLAAAGLALLVMSFTSLLEVIIANISIMPTVIGSVIQLGVAFLILGASLLVSSLGFFAFGLALLFFVGVGIPAIGALLIPLFFLGLALVGVAASMYLLGIGSTKAASAISPLSLGLAAIAETSPDIGKALLVSALGFLAFGIALFQLGATGIPALYALAVPLVLFALALAATSIAMVLFGSAVTVMAPAVSVLAGSFGQLSTFLPAVALSLGLLAIGFFALGASLMFAAAGIPVLSAMALSTLFFGFALAIVAVSMSLLGTSTTIAASGISSMAGSFEQLAAFLPTVAQSIGLLAIGLFALVSSLLFFAYFGIPALSAMALPLLFFGFALAAVATTMSLLGDGTTTAASGASSMANGFQMLSGLLPEMGSSFGLLALTFSAMAGSMLFLAYVTGTFGTTLALLALPLAIVGSAIAGIALAIRSMATSISQIAADNGMITLVATVNSVEEAKVENLEDIVDQAQRYVSIKAQMNAIEIGNSIASGLANMLGVSTSDKDAKNSQNQKEIVLKLNDREFARAVVEALDGQTKISLA
jgi:hypothetical protein